MNPVGTRRKAHLTLAPRGLALLTNRALLVKIKRDLEN